MTPKPVYPDHPKMNYWFIRERKKIYSEQIITAHPIVLGLLRMDRQTDGKASLMMPINLKFPRQMDGVS
jgi:hypothetical protein